MAIAGDSINQILLLHHDEGNAVRQSPVFVSARLIQIESLCQECRIDADDLDVVGAVTLLNKLNCTATIKPTQGISYFDQNSLGEPNF